MPMLNDVSAPFAPLVDAARVRVPFLVSHAIAYLVGIAVLAGTLGPSFSAAWGLVGYYAAIIVISIAALFLGRAPIASLLVADAITVPLIPLVTGQHPASVHVTMLVMVLAAAAITRLRVALTIGLIELVGFTAGTANRAGGGLAVMEPMQIDRSEVGGMIVGAMVGTIAIVVLSRLLRTALATQTEALQAQQRTNALQSRFVSMVSHELRTPLTSIRGFAEVLVEDRGTLSDLERQEFTQAIAEQSIHLSRLVDDVLDVVRIDAQRVLVRSEPVDVRRSIAVATSMLSPVPARSVEVGPVSACNVRGDGDRLVQVLRNLIENGMKYGGEVVRVSAEADGTSMRIVVEDDGAGVPDHLVEEIFDEFMQVGRPAERVTSGFGLGLPIARRLVEAMGGRIWAQRSTMGGAAFVVELPLDEKDAESDAEARPVSR